MQRERDRASDTMKKLAKMHNKNLSSLVKRELCVDGAGIRAANGKYIKLDCSVRPKWALSCGNWTQQQWAAITGGCPWYEKTAHHKNDEPMCIFYYSVPGKRTGWHLANSKGASVYFIEDHNRGFRTEPPNSGTYEGKKAAKKLKWDPTYKGVMTKGWTPIGWGVEPTPTHSMSRPD